MELGFEQNEKKSEVALRVRATALSKSINFRCKSHEQMEKCLFYSAIQKSAQTDVRKESYNSFIEKNKKW